MGFRNTPELVTFFEIESSPVQLVSQPEKSFRYRHVSLFNIMSIAMSTSENEHLFPPGLILAGMHRSGTSLMASCLADAGLDFGKNLIGAGHGNENGHYEDLSICQLHERILESLGVNTQGYTKRRGLGFPPPAREEALLDVENRRIARLAWGWKQPRATLFLDEWAALVPEAHFLLMFRRPWEVIDSLYRRGDSAFVLRPEFALRIWENYNAAILDFHSRHKSRCLIVEASQIVDCYETVMDSLGELLGVTLQSQTSKFKENNFLSEPNGHHKNCIMALAPNAMDIYVSLQEQTVGPSEVKKHNELELLPRQRRRLFFTEWRNASSANQKLALCAPQSAENLKKIEEIAGKLAESHASAFAMKKKNETTSVQLALQAAEIATLNEKLKNSEAELNRLKRERQFDQQKQEITNEQFQEDVVLRFKKMLDARESHSNPFFRMKLWATRKWRSLLKIFWRKNTSKEHYESGEMGGEASGVQSKKSKNDRSAA